MPSSIESARRRQQWPADAGCRIAIGRLMSCRVAEQLLHLRARHRALLVEVAAKRAADAHGADDLIAHADRHAAAQHQEAGDLGAMPAEIGSGSVSAMASVVFFARPRCRPWRRPHPRYAGRR